MNGALARQLGALLLCWAALGATGAAAQSLYEAERAERAARLRSFAIEPHPEGKRIAFVEVAREDVLVEDELWPVWPNAFHWLTDEDVIRRELLFAPGQLYDEDLVEETMRNLRGLGIFALVRIVPVQTQQPNTVGLLVYTRDLWSLRLETAFLGTLDSYQLAVQLAERNFLGRNKLVAARFHVDPKSFRLGQAYYDARVLGGELALSERFDVVFDRDGEPDGSLGALSLSQPFRRLSQVWAFSATASYANVVQRSLDGSDYGLYLPDGSPCEDPDDPRCLRSVFRDRSYAASLSASHRSGIAYKQTVSVGVAFGDREVEPTAETALEPGQEPLFEELLPRTRRQVYPFVTHSLFVPDFAVFENLSTFGKSENVRLGPSLSASVSLPLEAFGSSTDSVRFEGALGWVLARGDALGEIAAAGEARLEEGRVVDQRASVVLRGATPVWLLGRVVLRSNWEGRRRDTGKPRVVLGGDTGLRGYPSGEFRAVGANRLLANVEYRTLPLVFESVHVGAVVFYDAGSVYTDVSSIDVHHAAGAGLRVLFPQFNQSPFRIDFGVPLDAEGFAVVVSYGSAQAVPLTAADDAESTGAL